MPLNTILYQSSSGFLHLVVVINGQPYYRVLCSEEQEDAYFRPFLMLKGSSALINDTKVPDGYKKQTLLGAFKRADLAPTAAIPCNRDMFDGPMIDVS